MREVTDLMVDVASAVQRRGESGDLGVPTSVRGSAVLSNPVLNKGVAFSISERSALGLTGLLPPGVLTLAEQVDRDYRQFCELPTDLAKAVFLAGVHSRNLVLFHRLLGEHLAEMLPIVYTPTIGAVIQQYSQEYRRPGGVYLSIDHPQDIETALAAHQQGAADVDLVLATDGEGILGIGDWGVGGIEIAIGKLAVYTAGAGIDPTRVLPVMLDVGTENRRLLDDPVYVGNRHPRAVGERYDAFIDAFVVAVTRMFPQALLHWEDLGATNARRVLQRYRERVCTFNDDMQGTGAVALAATLAGSRATRTRLRDHRVVIFGAGTAGIGIADQLREAFVADGLDPDQARGRFWCLGRRGLVLAGQHGLRDFQYPYARALTEVDGWRRDAPGAGVDLLEVVRRIRPTILIGTSGVAGAFGQDVVTEMAAHVEQPIILPMSNPTELAEALPGDLMAWTRGQALIATGSPSPAITYDGHTYQVAQANNALVFPGIGLGVIVSRARTVTDGMLTAAAHAVADCVDAGRPGAPLLPEVNEVRAVSAVVAARVARAAQADGVARVQARDWDAAVAVAMWNPVYRPVVAVVDDVAERTDPRPSR
jgi:malate dehydrogenase (oxaloacetate-decarboxylating)